MKSILALCTICIVLVGCSTLPTDQKSDFPYAYVPLMDWPSRHWKGQDYKPSINPEDAVIRQSADRSQSMFFQGQAITPKQFIENLKTAKIIKRIYNPKFGFFWDRQVSDDVVIELDENFYTLSYADQAEITDMLSRAYQKRHYMLQDSKTKKMVGQITPEGFLMF